MISFLISVHLLLTGGLLTAFEVLPLLLVLIIPYPETFVNKNPNGAAVVFSCSPALIQTAGRGFVIYQLSRQLHRSGRPPADKLQHRESRLRLSVFLLPYPEARPPGFPVSIIPPSLPAALAPAIRRRRGYFLKKKKDIIIILLSENDTLPSIF